MSSNAALPVRVAGRHYEVDSFVACVQAALSFWNRPVPYHWVAGLSAAAFAPTLEAGCACAGCIAASCGDMRLAFLGHALGFNAERLRASEGRLRARQAAQEGQVVLCDSPPAWGILTDWPKGQQARLARPAGLPHSDLVAEGSSLYVLRPAERCLTSYEAFREALCFGAELASGDCDGEDRVFGERTYDRWLQQADGSDFCPNGRPDGWRCARKAASRACTTQREAVRFLASGGNFPVPRRAARALNSAADAYGTMASALACQAHGARAQAGQARSEDRGAYRTAVSRARRLHRRAARHLRAAARRL